jgi:hypothetical protein
VTVIVGWGVSGSGLAADETACHQPHAEAGAGDLTNAGPRERAALAGTGSPVSSLAISTAHPCRFPIAFGSTSH